MQTPRPHRSGPATAAAVVALVTGGIGAGWLARPSTYPFGATDRVTMSVTHDLPVAVAGGTLLAAAALGLAIAVLAGRPAPGHRAAGPLAAGLAGFFALVMADTSLISLLGYALALGAPLVVTTGIVLACVRGGRWGRLAGAALLLLATVAVLAGPVDPGVLLRFTRNVLHAFAEYGTRLLWGLAMAALAGAWGAVAYRLLRAGRTGGRPGWARPERARRWGRVAALGAALCPLPYAFVRLTWLTPWAIGLDRDIDDPALRLQGGALGCAALIGAVLTVGLVSRWGEVVPGWVPVLGHRPVPVTWAVAPGGLVATATCVAAPGLLLHAVETGGFGEGLRGVAFGLLFFPFPVWGPLLAAAVLAYALRRRPVEAPVAG
ncbi:hypothetical protein [Micromonospora mirobrigensis]|uniref:Uncharacterized protein n=1 Tax=Micromonospora mirobrigensis TaxID=262898 RepID=A0A1C4W706_9ACTN|nr:hypothetical protein [Micromonospora mirobrigensis]SCE91968.1 hypothetical protein GA0070564_10248 [Micromonospora mirobrigensis]